MTGSIQNFVRPHFYPKQAKEGMDFCMITEQDMKQAIEFSEMLAKMSALYVPGQTYFVAWGEEDYKIVAEGCKRHKLDNPLLLEDYLDLAAAYKLMKGDSYTYRPAQGDRRAERGYRRTVAYSLRRCRQHWQAAGETAC